MFKKRNNTTMSGYYDDDGEYIEPVSDYGDDDIDDLSGPVQPARPVKKKSGAPVVLIAIALVLVVVIAAGSIIGAIVGPTRGECKELLEDFEEGCREMDLYKLVNCIDPRFRTAANFALLAGDTLTGDSLDTVLQTLDNAMGGTLSEAADGTSQTLENTIKSIRIKPIRYGLPGKDRVVQCKVTVGVFEQYVKVTIRKKHREAYIANVRLDRS